MLKLGDEARAPGRQAEPDQQTIRNTTITTPPNTVAMASAPTSAGPSEAAWTGAGATKTRPIASDRSASPCRHVTGTCIAFTWVLAVRVIGPSEHDESLRIVIPDDR